MKLNHDCMRACLLYLESKENVHVNVCDENLNISFDPVFIETIFDDLTAWTNHDIFYALFNLEQGGYINATAEYSDGSIGIFCVNFITFGGHEFLDSIRDDTRWNRIKKGLKDSIRDYSLSAITAVASGLTSSTINAFFSGQLGL